MIEKERVEREEREGERRGERAHQHVQTSFSGKIQILLALFSHRYEMIDILRSNNFTTPNMERNEIFVTGKRAKQVQG